MKKKQVFCVIMKYYNSFERTTIQNHLYNMAKQTLVFVFIVFFCFYGKNRFFDDFSCFFMFFGDFYSDFRFFFGFERLQTEFLLQKYRKKRFFDKILNFPDHNRSLNTISGHYEHVRTPQHTATNFWFSVS